LTDGQTQAEGRLHDLRPGVALGTRDLRRMCGAPAGVAVGARGRHGPPVGHRPVLPAVRVAGRWTDLPGVRAVGKCRSSWVTVAICKGVTRDGKPCSARPRPGTDLCPWHSPDLAARRAEWSRRGGRNSSNKQRAQKALPAAPTPDELQRTLGQALADVLSGALEPGRANAAAALGRTLLAIRESVEVEARLAALEQAAFGERRGA
jgi:hypothetical protein